MPPYTPKTPAERRSYRQKWVATITHTTDCFGRTLPEPSVYSWTCYTHALPHVAESHALHNARTQWLYGQRWPHDVTVTAIFDDPDACGLLDDEPLAAVRSTYGMGAAA